MKLLHKKQIINCPQKLNQLNVGEYIYINNNDFLTIDYKVLEVWSFIELFEMLFGSYKVNISTKLSMGRPNYYIENVYDKNEIKKIIEVKDLCICIRERTNDYGGMYLFIHNGLGSIFSYE